MTTVAVVSLENLDTHGAIQAVRSAKRKASALLKALNKAAFRDERKTRKPKARKERKATPKALPITTGPAIESDAVETFALRAELGENGPKALADTFENAGLAVRTVGEKHLTFKALGQGIEDARQYVMQALEGFVDDTMRCNVAFGSELLEVS
jgi:hypothetical protein